MTVREANDYAARADLLTEAVGAECQAAKDMLEAAKNILHEIRPKISPAKFPELCARIDGLLQENT